MVAYAIGMPEQRKRPSIVRVCRDQNLFAPWFKDPTTWVSWFVFLKAIFGIRLKTPQELELYETMTGRRTQPKDGVTEAWLVVGRRGGKSFILALIAVYIACFINWKPFLSPGELGTVMIVASDRKQARVIFRYISAFFENIPMLRKLVTAKTKDSLELKSLHVAIEIHTCSFRAVRGYTIVAALLDEIAFWRSDDSANPDREILEAIRPGMSTVPNAILLGASSPYARRGVLWQSYKDGFAKELDDVLVVQAPTKLMHPNLPDSVIERAYKKDPASAASEYGAQFRSDVEAFITQEIIDDTTVLGRTRLPYHSDRQYHAFVDASGGSQDSFTLAVAHHEPGTQRVVLDVVEERKPPFKPDEVTREYAEIIKAYHIAEATGDRYAGEWPRERFLHHGIIYRVAGTSRSELYQEFLPLLTGGRVELLDHDILAAQLGSLERRTSKVGRDIVGHPPGGHDDVANVVAGVCVKVAERLQLWTDAEAQIGGELYSATSDFHSGLDHIGSMGDI